jgi:hypothetical protein
MLSGPPQLPRGAVCAAWMMCSTVMLSLSSPSGRGCFCPATRCCRLRAAGCKLSRRAQPWSSTVPLTSLVNRAAALPMRFCATRRWIACLSSLAHISGCWPRAPLVADALVDEGVFALMVHHADLHVPCDGLLWARHGGRQGLPSPGLKRRQDDAVIPELSEEAPC